ncbi:hypothetical protein DJ81_09335 [Halorubrum sp. Hd13]|nr:hypothetical protein DJ81_09335 [Halorubrum sp. Hd13]
MLILSHLQTVGQQIMNHSRRMFIISTLGLAGLGSTSGCLDVLSRSEPAFLSYKGIKVQWATDRVQGYVADLCWLWSDGQSRIFGWEPEEYPDIVRTATDVAVSDETFRALQERFTGVRFLVGLSSVETANLSLLESDFGHLDVSRERFNRLQFGDGIQVNPTDSGVRIRAIQKGEHNDPTDWTVTIGTKNLAEQFPDSQVPEPN